MFGRRGGRTNRRGIGRVGAPWWEVNALANWRANYNVTLNGGGSQVLSWISGGGKYELVQTIPADQPIWASSEPGFGGAASIDGDGISENIGEIGSANSIGALVGRGNDTPYAILASGIGNGIGTDTWAGFTQEASTDWWQIHQSNPISGVRTSRRPSGTTTHSAQAGAPGFGNTVILTDRFNGTTLDSWINNTQVLTATPLDTATMNSNPDRFGFFAHQRPGGTAIDHINASVHEIIICDVNDDLQGYRDRMAARVGLTL